MQLVNLTLSFRVLKLPHPLLSDDVNLNRILWRPRQSEIDARSPDEDADKDEERDNRPTEFDPTGRARRQSKLISRSPTIFDSEVCDEDDDSGCDEPAQTQQEIEERVNAMRFS